MERLFTYWAKHCPTFGADSRAFIRSRSQVKHYAHKQLIRADNERFPFFCIVLSGLVAGYRQSRAGKSMLCELMQPMDYFTGTQHPFTSRLSESEYVALEQTTILLIPVVDARDGQLRLPAFAELVHIMKQRKINFLELLIALEDEESAYDRYRLYIERFGNQARWLPDAPQWQLLRMGRSTYYRMKSRYARERSRR